MMTLQQNKQRMHYALQSEYAIPMYDYYIDNDGNKLPIETGEYRYPYNEVVSFAGNIAMSGGEARSVEYGVDIGAYEAILIVGHNELPLTETSVIWLETAPQYYEDGTVDEKSADYRIIKISPSLNFDKYVLARVVK